jgi:ribonuclease HI
MLNTGKKYNLHLDALRIPESVKRQLPAWYHLGAKDNPVGFNRAHAPKCLKSKHQIMTVGDLIRMMNWIRDANPHDIHQDLNTCQCSSCAHDHTLGCTDPNQCCQTVQTIIERLKPKWRPSACENMDGLSLTPGRKLRNEDARIHNQKVTFDPTIAREGDLHSYF